MTEPARRYGFALVRKESNEIEEFFWTRAEARGSLSYNPEADGLRIERARVTSCVKPRQEKRT